MFDRDAARRWLGILHADAPGYVHICATGDWTGQAFPTAQLDAAVSYAQTLDAGGREGIYARVSTLKAPLAPGKRGGAEDSCALPALWADVDIAGPGHKEANLPPTEEAGRELITRSGLPVPTVWVRSGGGLYPFWFFDTPQIVDEHNRADLIDLSANWQKVIGAAASAAGWHYGTGVGDLSRVLRLPGSVNRKAGLERPCAVSDVGFTGHRYRPAQLVHAAVDRMASIVAEKLEVATTTRHDDASPGDEFAARTDWADLLEPHGWELSHARDGVRYWRRPGKRDGVSATTNALGTDRLRVFTTSTDFDVASYSKLGAFAVLEYGGDLHAAAKALRASGFGGKTAQERQRDAIEELTGQAVPQYPPTGRPIVDVELPAEPSMAEATMDKLAYHEEVKAEAHRQRVRRDATQLLKAEDYEKAWREPASTLTLAQELEQPDEPVTYRIERLLPTGGNVMLAAQFKAGKTTLCNNLVKALADDEPFLGRFDCAPLDGGRVALFNYEVGEAQYRAWLREQGIGNTDRVCVLNIRGFRLPPTVSQVEDWIIKWLIDRRVKVWIVDPFARAFVGCGEENSNADVGVFLDTLDVIKERAGVEELILPVHTGRAEQEHGGERARGATRLDDWPDARWLLTVDEQQRRFFRAAGRDVDVDEEMLTFDAACRRLTLGGWDRTGMRRMDLVDELVGYVAANPGAGVNDIVAGTGKGRSRVIAALQQAVHKRLITVVVTGRNRHEHYPLGALPRIDGQE